MHLFYLFFRFEGFIIMETKVYKRRFGDRYDGRRVRTISPMTRVGVYIMKHRNGSSNLMADCFDITELEDYIHRKRREGLDSFGMMHVMAAAYVRAISQKPAINRFISGQKIYARNKIELMLVVKTEMNVFSPDTIIKVEIPRDATADDIYHLFKRKIEDERNADTNFDDTAAAFNKIPGLLLKFAIWFLNFLDYFGILPKSLIQVSPFHGSMFMTSMGSLGIPAIYHHLYDFGNVPVFMAFSAKRKVNELNAQGEVVQRKYIDYTFVTDERICDGFYYASAFKFIKSLLKNPERLDVPPETIVEDIP